MSYDVLEKEIRQLPESYLEDVSKYIQFLLYQYEQERMSALEESDEVFNAKMQKGLDDVRNGRLTPIDDASHNGILRFSHRTGKIRFSRNILLYFG